MTFSSFALGGLSVDVLAVALAGVFAGAVIRGFTGFGLPLAAVPVMTLVMAPSLAVPAMLLLQILAGLLSLPRIYRSIHWSALAWLAAGAAAGIPAGTALLAQLPPDVMRLCIGLAMLVAVGALAWGFRSAHMPGIAARLGTGVLAGVMSGAAAMPGPPVVAFFLASPANATVSRASLVVFFMVTGVISLALATASGLVTSATVMLGVVLTPALALGTWAGEWVFHRTKGRNYRPAALTVLLAIGLMATGRAAWELFAG